MGMWLRQRWGWWGGRNLRDASFVVPTNILQKGRIIVRPSLSIQGHSNAHPFISSLEITSIA